ncbi:MAG TPA: hypothetical protein VKR23_07215 [Gaiellaceae bacterium]|nr:hypothetical protein [Gaiellaceae bacterium]
MARPALAALLAALAFAGSGHAAPPTFAAEGTQAAATLLNTWYAGDGLWRQCNAADCATGNRDWGYDSLTYALALRYRATRDPSLLAIFRGLEQTSPSYPAPCTDAATCSSWSDVPMWDTIALLDDYSITQDFAALAKAEATFAFVDGSSVYAHGACPSIPYQQPGGGGNDLKTLETEANYVKAAIMLYEATHDQSYLTKAENAYNAARTSFLDPSVPLYTVYVFDNGAKCTQVPHRFFASVNGDMIWSGFELYHDTGAQTFLRQSIATARAVTRDLGDAHGIFTDLQAENDVVEPLVEGMGVLAATGQTFARTWILRNAAASLSARTADGSFGRFFDGPAPTATVTAWQTNGGLALEIAAAALAPKTTASAANAWAKGQMVEHAVSTLPASITFHGSAIAVYGTLGEQCCEPGHARVFVDGHETFDGTGIWQNKSVAGIAIPNTLLFAWRWPRAGTHTITFQPGVANAKEGGSFLDLTSYEVVR